jgi:redox-sensitive bicupin YhaK (pirin superfamily)
MDILKPHDRDLGGGLIVHRVLPGHPHQMVGPFIFFDQMGPMTAAPGQNVDVRPAPAHRPGHGHLAVRRRDDPPRQPGRGPADRAWGRELDDRRRRHRAFGARRSAVAQERAPHARIQSWVALPKSHEDAAPSFSHHAAPTLPKIRLPGVELRLIAGDAFGEKAPRRRSRGCSTCARKWTRARHSRCLQNTRNVAFSSCKARFFVQGSAAA